MNTLDSHSRALARLLAATLFCALLAAPSLLDAAETIVLQPAHVTHVLTGFTRPRRSLPLASEVPGRVAEVLAETGHPLGDDGAFLRLDDTFVRLELAKTKIALERAERTLDFDRRELARAERLRASSAVSQELLERRQLAVALDELTVQELRNGLAILEERRRRHTVRGAPGYLVEQRLVEAGQWIAAGQVVARIGDYSRLLVPLALSEAEYRALTTDPVVRLDLPDLELAVTARVWRTSPAFDPVSRKRHVDLLIEADPPLPSQQRRGGIRATLRLRLPDPMRGLVVPAAAVQERFEEHWVWRPDGAQVRVLVLGPAEPPDGAGGNWLRISSAELAPGDRLLRRPPQTP